MMKKFTEIILSVTLICLFSVCMQSDLRAEEHQQAKKKKTEPKLSVLCLYHRLQEGIADILQTEHNIHLDDHWGRNLTLERLKNYHAVILLDSGGTEKDYRQRAKVLEQYVKAGGGLYIFVGPAGHMSSGKKLIRLNPFLEKLGANALFELLRDPKMEKRQPEGKKELYARAAHIVSHPVTEGIDNYWYPIGPYGYGAWVYPIQVDDSWQSLILSSEEYTSQPLTNPQGHAKPDKNAKSELSSEKAVIMAARKYGRGRIVLNGGEGTTSFIGFNYSPYADFMWGRVSMEKGLDGIESDGRKMLVNALRWISEPALQNENLGGFTRDMEKIKRNKMERADPLEWKPLKEVNGRSKFQKGVMGVIPELGGGSGTVEEYVKTAKEMELDYLVIAADFEKTSKDQWDKLTEECEKYTSDTFLAMCALITRDEQDNSFLQAMPRSWPAKNRLSPEKPKRVKDHLGYWMRDNQFPFRAPFWFSRGDYPNWLYSGINSYAIHTYKDGKLVDNALDGFFSESEQGTRLNPISVNLISKPTDLKKVEEFTYYFKNNIEQLKKAFDKNTSGSNMSFISDGPIIEFWHCRNNYRSTLGDLYVPGLERWRCRLKVRSEIPLKTVTIYNYGKVFRKFDAKGKKELGLTFNGLHDNRHVMVAVIEDQQGNKAISGAITTASDLMDQRFCSDRCNLMGGGSVIRTEQGFIEKNKASNFLYKAGRLHIATVPYKQELPGVDGSGIGSQFSLRMIMTLEAEDAKGEKNSPLHRIGRPYQSDDLIIFDTPILKRSAVPSNRLWGHRPYVPLMEPNIQADLFQYHFYRKPIYPSPVTADIRMTITQDKVKLKKGWQNFSVQFAGSSSKDIKKYMIIRSDDSIEQGPSSDESEGTGYRGELFPGDSIYFPDVQEGFYVLRDKVAVVIECRPSEQWFRLWIGKFDTPELKKGDTIQARIVSLKIARANTEDEIERWKEFGNKFGIREESPSFSVTAEQGKQLPGKYWLFLEAENNGFKGKISRDELPQRLPVKISGLNPRWTAAKIPLDKNEWYPVGVSEQGVAYTTMPRGSGTDQVYIGNLVSTDNDDLFLTLLPPNAEGKSFLCVHNPTDKQIDTVVSTTEVILKVPISRFKVSVPPFSTKEIEIDTVEKEKIVTSE